MDWSTTALWDLSAPLGQREQGKGEGLPFVDFASLGI